MRFPQRLVAVIALFVIACAGTGRDEESAVPPTEGGSAASPSPNEGPGTETEIVGIDPVDRSASPASAGLLPEDPVERENLLQSRIDAISQALLEREPEKALALLDEAMSWAPPEPFAQRLRSLEARTRRKLLEETWIDAFVTFEKPRYTVGDVIQGEIVLVNISTRTLMVPRLVALPGSTPEAPQESRTLFRSVTTYREYLPDGTLVVNADTRNFELDDDIVLSSGQAHRIPVAIDTMTINPQSTALKTYTIDSKVMAAEIRVDGRVFNGAINFRPAVARVYPRNAEHLAVEPMEKVVQAFEKSSTPHLVLAASMVEKADRPRLLQFIHERLGAPETPEAMCRAFESVLLFLSGEDRNRSKEEWIQWINGRR